MSLYDGVGIDAQLDKNEQDIASWSSGIKLLQSQLQLKKTQQVKREMRRGNAILAPVVDLKSRRGEPEPEELPFIQQTPRGSSGGGGGRNSSRSSSSNADPDWSVRDCYDPMWPNDYEKIMKERRERKEKDREEERRKELDERRKRSNERYGRGADGPGPRDSSAGPAGPPRAKSMHQREEEEEEMMDDRPRRPNTSGAAIAPPPSLLEDSKGSDLFSSPGGSNLIPSLGGSVAAKIMAKYGFREGQGLGRLEQGMSQALQVEKTSKRGGKIIHEKDIPKDQPPSPPSPPRLSFAQPPPQQARAPSPPAATQTPTPVDTTEAMKNPTKVVLLRNMVGPGEVDDDLEPEVKEECTKYGEVHKCVIYEIPAGPEDEAVRIFVEFKRIESAIKAVVDLNGRYFGGRTVKAGFYNLDKFKRLELGG